MLEEDRGSACASQSPCPVAVPGEPSSAARAEAPRGLGDGTTSSQAVVMLRKSPPVPWHCCSQLRSLHSSTASDWAFF